MVEGGIIVSSDDPEPGLSGRREEQVLVFGILKSYRPSERIYSAGFRSGLEGLDTVTRHTQREVDPKN